MPARYPTTLYTSKALSLLAASHVHELSPPTSTSAQDAGGGKVLPTRSAGYIARI